MTDKVIIITGASDGIGAAAAKFLKLQGANVVIVGRSPHKTKAVASELNAPYYLADYTKLGEVRALASQLKKDYSRIDVLANNAGGIMDRDRRFTVDGHEMTVQVDYLAHFLLTNLLLDTLIASKASIIFTASVGHRFAGKLNLDDINMEHGYSSMRAYGKAKLMIILFARELHKRYHADGIATAAFHPGTVRTNFGAEFRSIASLFYTTFINRLFISPAKGADTLVWLATSQPGKDWQSGEYYSKRKIKSISKQARDTNLAYDLWELSAQLTEFKK